MKGWVLADEKNLIEQEITETESSRIFPKVKITKALITLGDVLKYNGELDCENVVLCQTGIGIISEIEKNLFDLEKGQRVFVEPNVECGECNNCLDDQPRKCSNIFIAGDNVYGFLRDFASAPSEQIFALPDNVSDFEALFINQIARAISVIDRIDIQKGDYVAVMGDSNFAIILCELLMYYSAVPILITNTDEYYDIAKKSGIYYVLNEKDNAVKEVSQITSGRMAEKVVFINDGGVTATKAFALASYGAEVAFTGVFSKNNTASLNQAIRKQLDIRCINNGFGNTGTSINLLSNKAFNLEFLKINSTDYQNVVNTFESLSNDFESSSKITETIVEIK